MLVMDKNKQSENFRTNSKNARNANHEIETSENEEILKGAA